MYGLFSENLFMSLINSFTYCVQYVQLINMAGVMLKVGYRGTDNVINLY